MQESILYDKRLGALRDAIPKLDERSRAFARDLLAGAQRRKLSEKQDAWIDKLIARSANPDPDRSQKLGAAFAGVVELLDRAAANLKWPRLLFRAGEADYRLTIAGTGSSSPGSINVTTAAKGEDGNRQWFGRVTRDGEFKPARSLDDPTVTAITGALTFLAEDPAGAAKVYGLSTGVCCFCGLELTDKRSINVGYGPVCAEKWGLPWGH